MENDYDKRINELEAKNTFQEDAIERLSDEVRRQQQEIISLKEKLLTVINSLEKNNLSQEDKEKPPHY
tara:strand:+ start:339 stop:542 length:204 start_codon:yes stop_codon:yes gene_type:complete